MVSGRKFWRHILCSISMVLILNIIHLHPTGSSLTCTVDTCDSEVESGGVMCYCDYNCEANGDCCDQSCNVCEIGCNTTVTTVPTVFGNTTCENNCGSSQICEDSSTCCGCDSMCTFAGDCCSDYSDFCTNSTTAPTVVTYTTSCNSSCGEAICDDDDNCCYCDTSCLLNDDCCDDFTLLCVNETNIPTTSPTMMATIFPTSMPTLYTTVTETALSPTLNNAETSMSPSSSSLTMAPSIEVTNAPSSASSSSGEEEFQIAFQVLLTGLDQETFDEEAQESFKTVTAALLGIEERQISLVVTAYSDDTAIPTMDDGERQLTGSSGIYVDVVITEISGEAIATQLAEDLSGAIEDGTYISNLQDEGLSVTNLTETVAPTVEEVAEATPSPSIVPTSAPTESAIVASNSVVDSKKLVRIVRIAGPIVAVVILLTVCCILVYKKIKPGQERILAHQGSVQIPQEDDALSDVEEVENPLAASEKGSSNPMHKEAEDVQSV